MEAVNGVAAILVSAIEEANRYSESWPAGPREVAANDPVRPVVPASPAPTRIGDGVGLDAAGTRGRGGSLHASNPEIWLSCHLLGEKSRRRTVGDVADRNAAILTIYAVVARTDDRSAAAAISAPAYQEPLSKRAEVSIN